MTVGRRLRRCGAVAAVASMVVGAGILSGPPVGAEEGDLFEGRAVSVPVRVAANVFEFFAIYSESRLTNADGGAFATWLYPGAVGTAAAELQGISPPAASAVFPPGGESAMSFTSPPGAPAPPGKGDPGRAEAQAGEKSSRSTVTLLPVDENGVTVGGGVATTSVDRLDGAVVSSAYQEITGIAIGDTLRFDAIRAWSETKADGAGQATATTELEFIGATLAGQAIRVTSDGRIEPGGDGGPVLGPGRETIAGVLAGLGFRARLLAPEQTKVNGGISAQSPGLLLESGSADSYTAIEFGRAASTARLDDSSREYAEEPASGGDSGMLTEPADADGGVGGDAVSFGADAGTVQPVATDFPVGDSGVGFDVPGDWTVVPEATGASLPPPSPGFDEVADLSPGGFEHAASAAQPMATSRLAGRSVATADPRIAATLQTLAKVLIAVAVAILGWTRLVRALVRS